MTLESNVWCDHMWAKSYNKCHRGIHIIYHIVPYYYPLNKTTSDGIDVWQNTDLHSTMQIEDFLLPACNSLQLDLSGDGWVMVWEVHPWTASASCGQLILFQEQLMS